MQSIIKGIKETEREAFIWIAGLIFLAVINPYGGTHLSFCPLHNIGFKYCPGCGLGRSVSFLFHGDIHNSIESHILGIPALIIIVYRIIYLIRKPYVKVFQH